MSTNLGFLAIARPTFDVPFAETMATDAFRALQRSHSHVRGNSKLLMDEESVVKRANELHDEDLDAVVVLQATFADSSLVTAVAKSMPIPLVLWAVPEPQVGGRLRLNSLCGINLAAYVLARRDDDYRWIYRSPSDPLLAHDMARAIESPHQIPEQRATPVRSTGEITIAGKTIGVIGDRPDGFEPCDYDEVELMSLTGVAVDRVELTDWFQAGALAAPTTIDEIRGSTASSLTGVESLDADALSSSIRLAAGLEQLADQRGWSGVATRCWPECFTQFGGAACFANARMSSSGLPGSCEADVYGNVTAVLLQSLTELPPFVADLVGIDFDADTATFWHCGMASLELAAPNDQPRATVHSNRQKPLLNEFRLRPGTVTIARLSQSRNSVRLVVGAGEILDEPLPFSGTSGVARLESGATTAFDTIMSNGLEHHYGIAYGDLRAELASYAHVIGVDVLSL